MTTIRARIRRLSGRSEALRLQLSATVREVLPLSPSFVRVIVHCNQLADYTPVLATDGFKLSLPDGDRSVLRAFTTRHVDRDRGELTIDILRHPQTVTGRWLRSLSSGDEVTIFAARRDFALGDGIEHHLLIADACALPAVATILEALPTDARVTAILHAPSVEDQIAAATRPGDDVRWILGTAPEGDDPRFRDALARLDLDPVRRQVWIATEAGVAAHLRREVSTLGIVKRDDLHAVAYWKAGLTNDARDQRMTTAFLAAVDRNDDVADPLVRASLEAEADLAT